MGATAYAALVLLAFGDATGYELKQRADSTLRFFFNSPAMSQVYTELERLAAGGLVATTGASRGASESRRYSLTGAGLEELRRWVSDDPLPATVFKSHLALRLVVGHLGGEKRLGADIVAERTRVRAELDQLDAVLQQLDPSDPELGWAWLVARWGDRYYRDLIGQLDMLREELDDPDARHAAVADRRLDGAAVSLIPVAGEHHEALRAIHRTTEVLAVWGEPDPAWPDDPSVHGYAIVTASSETVIGFVQWGEETDPQYRHANIDIFVDPAHHGCGIGTASVRLLIEHLTTERRHHRIVIDPAANNAPAIACYRKAGFREVGVMRSYERGADGAFHDGLLMEFVHAETEARR